VVPSAGRFVVRAERSTDAVMAIAGELPVASPDGKRVAFWRTGPQGSNPQELRIVDVPGGAERMLTTIAPGFFGGPIVWSNDGTGLLYEYHRSETVGVSGRIVSSRLESFDLSATQAAGATDSQLELTNGFLFVALSWNRAGALATALVTGDGGYAVDYVTWDRRVQPAGQSAVKFTRFPWPVGAFTVQASYDAQLMLAIDYAANVLRIWPAGDIAISGDVGPGTARISGARWRPATPRDVAWVIDRNVGTFTYQTGSSGTIHRGQGEVRILTWRVDGSGLVLSEQVRGDFVVEMSSGQASALSGLGEVVGGSRLGAVLLR
jgi:hypothetical protein